MQDRGRLGVLLVAPALAAVLVLFVYPLGYSLVTAFQAKGGGFTFGNFAKAFEFYSVDIGFTLVIIGVSTLLIALASIAIGGYLTLGENPRAVALLRWLYRWPLFIPFVVAAQCMRTFLAKNGLMNNTFVGARHPGSRPDRRLPRLARHHHYLRLEADAVRRAAGRRRHGLARPLHHRGGAKPRRLAAAHPVRDPGAAGDADAGGRTDPVVRHHDERAVGAADDQRRVADHDDRGHGLPHQQLRRLRHRERARLHLLPAHRRRAPGSTSGDGCGSA